ncbi:MAG: hypothetical protein J7L46_00535, partial [Bacteroidales bacterium]|nr:hypothetical protein [Bacteroidales bacterium]
MKRTLPFVIFYLTSIFLIGNHIACAETIHSDLYGFSITIPDDWSKRKPTKSWTYFVYADLKSGANLNINVIDAEGIFSIKQPTLEEIFSPYYEHVKIIEKIYETDSLSKTDLLKCIYRWKDGDFKKQYEGKYRLQYYAVQWIKDEKLFTLTFTDSERNFPKNLRKFKNIANSIEFSTNNAEYWEGKKILVDEREKVISACEKGISSRGFSYVKAQKYCECSVNYMT